GHKESRPDLCKQRRATRQRSAPRLLRFCRPLIGAQSLAIQMEAWSLTHGTQIDSVQNQRQLRSRDLQSRCLILRVRLGDLIGSLLKLLVPDAIARLSPIQDLDAIAPPVHEDEQVARKRILLQLRFGQRDEAVEAFAHVRRVAIQEHTDLGRQRNHASLLPSRMSNRRSRSAAGTWPVTRTR